MKKILSYLFLILTLFIYSESYSIYSSDQPVKIGESSDRAIQVFSQWKDAGLGGMVKWFDLSLKIDWNRIDCKRIKGRTSITITEFKYKFLDEIQNQGGMILVEYPENIYTALAPLELEDKYSGKTTKPERPVFINIAYEVNDPQPEYTGNFKDGKKNGHGKQFNAEGEPEGEGEFENDELCDGNGKRRMYNGTYVGDLKSCQPDGRGKMDYDNGESFDGEWMDGNMYSGTYKYDSSEYAVYENGNKTVDLREERLAREEQERQEQAEAESAANMALIQSMDQGMVNMYGKYGYKSVMPIYGGGSGSSTRSNSGSGSGKCWCVKWPDVGWSCYPSRSHAENELSRCNKGNGNCAGVESREGSSCFSN